MLEFANQRNGKCDVAGGGDGKPGSTWKGYFHGIFRSRIFACLDYSWNQGKELGR